MDQKHWFYRIVNGILRLLLAGVVFLLLLHSVFSTSFVGRLVLEDGSERERTFNISDSPLRHFLVFVVLTAVILAGKGIAQAYRARSGKADGADVQGAERGNGLRRHGGEKGCESVPARRREAVFWGLTLFTAAFGCAYVLMTKLHPSSDPAKVFAIAMQWRQGDFSAFDVEGYLFRYPFQSGIILFYYLLSFLFGVDNFVGPQLVNVICLAVIYGLLVKQFGLFSSLGRTEEKGRLQTAVYLGVLLWVPLSFYVTYLYGILPGMALSLGAVYFAGRYLLTRRCRYIAAASLCMGLATVIKMNCLIYLIAIACFLVWDALEQFCRRKRDAGWKWMVSLLFIACMGVSVALCTSLSNRLVERICGRELGEGEVMLSWVVMGMQEAPLGPGGYNGYNSEVFTANNYDTEKVTAACLEDLDKIVTRMSENPLDEGIPFLARKTAFQWNDPTFICLDRTRGRKGDADMPLWLKSLIEGRGGVKLSVLLNYMQTLILLGVLLFLLLRWRSGKLYELMGAVIFLGGWLFHLFWESSASYTIPYFLILVPYGVWGMAEWTAFLEKMAKKLRKRGSAEGTKAKRGSTEGIKAEREAEEGMKTGQEQTGPGEAPLGRSRLVTAALAAVFILLLAAFIRTNLFDRTIALNDDYNGIDASAQFYQTGQWDRGY